MNYLESEYEVAMAAMLLYAALLAMALAGWAWWSGEMFWGYGIMAVAVLLLLRSAKHVVRADAAVEREKERPEGIDLEPLGEGKKGFRKVAGEDLSDQ